MRDTITAQQIGMALRRVLLRKAFSAELAKITGAEAFTMSASERSTMNARENLTHLEIDGTLYRIVVSTVDR